MTVPAEGSIPPGTDAPQAPGTKPAHPLWLTCSWELEKLTAQFRTRLAVVVALLGPAAFAVGLKFATDVPADTLFGRWVADSGYAVPLVTLSFAGAWGFPLLVCLVAGDIFSAEDHARTWGTILTRAVSRRSIFGGKLLAAGAYAVLIMLLLTVSSVLWGLLTVGHQSLVGLSGNLESPGAALGLSLASWASVIPAALSFGALGVLVSVATRNSIAGIIVPAVIGALTQLLMLIGGGVDQIRWFLPGASFLGWVGMWAAPAFRGPMLIGIGSAVGYLAVFLAVAWWLFRRRDITGS